MLPFSSAGDYPDGIPIGVYGDLWSQPQIPFQAVGLLIESTGRVAVERVMVGIQVIDVASGPVPAEAFHVLTAVGPISFPPAMPGIALTVQVCNRAPLPVDVVGCFLGLAEWSGHAKITLGFAPWDRAVRWAAERLRAVARGELEALPEGWRG